MLKEEELEKIVRDSGMKSLITTNDLLGKIEGVASRLNLKVISGNVHFFLPDKPDITPSTWIRQ